MKITKGEKYLCIKDVVMQFSKKTEYSNGKIYTSEQDDCITNNSGENWHKWQTGKGYEDDDPKYYFTPLSSAKWAIKRTPENADELDKWSGQKWNGEIDIWVTSTKTWCNRLPTDHTEISFDTFKEIVRIEEENDKIIRELLGEDDPTEEWQPKWGKEYEFSNDNENWHKRLFLSMNPIEEGIYITVDHLHSESYFGGFLHVRQCQTGIPMSEALEIIAQAKGINKEQIKIVE